MIKKRYRICNLSWIRCSLIGKWMLRRKLTTSRKQIERKLKRRARRMSSWGRSLSSRKSWSLKKSKIKTRGSRTSIFCLKSISSSNRALSMNLRFKLCRVNSFKLRMRQSYAITKLNFMEVKHNSWINK